VGKGQKEEVLNSFLMLGSEIFITPYRKPSKSQIMFEELHTDKDSANLCPEHGLFYTLGCGLVGTVLNFVHNLTAFILSTLLGLRLIHVPSFCF
jgi:hypothetical protein